MAYNVQFTRCSQEKFDALETKDNNTIYFITDTPAFVDDLAEIEPNVELDTQEGGEDGE